MVHQHQKLYYLGLFLAASVFVLLMAGGAVTSHEAGLAVPDWPLSYGMLFPPMVGNIFWEHGHRMIAGFVALLTLITAISVQRTEERRWMRALAWAAFAAVIVQALLGGLTVLLLLPAPVSIAHACLAQTFFCIVIALAYFLSPFSKHKPAVDAGAPPREKLRRLALLSTGFVYLQLILGAIVRHAGFAVEWHIAAALLVVLHILFLMLRVWRFYAEKKYLLVPAVVLGVLTLTQIFLGMGSFIYTIMLERGHTPPLGEVLFTVAHQTNGAAILGLCVFVTLVIFPTPGARPAAAA